MAPSPRIERLTQARWKEFRRILEESGGEAPACMCTAYYGGDWLKEGQARRAAMFHREESDGYLLFLDAEPAGWCQCAPVSEGLRLPALPAEISALWAIPCMVLRPVFRGRGLCHEFLRLILDDLPRRGCRRVLVVGHRPEAYDPAESFMELPATVCERAGLSLERDDPVCPRYARTFPQEPEVP